MRSWEELGECIDLKKSQTMLTFCQLRYTKTRNNVSLNTEYQELCISMKMKSICKRQGPKLQLDSS